MTIGTAIVSGFFSLLAILLGWYLKRLSDKKKRDGAGYDAVRVLRHSFFQRDALLRSRLKEMKLGSEGRTALFRDMLKTMLDVFDERLKAFVRCAIFSTREEFCFKNQEIFGEILAETVRRWREDGVPDEVVSVFTEWNKKRCDLMVQNIMLASVSSFHSSYTERAGLILDEYRQFLAWTVLEAEAGLRKINGRISGIQYREFVI